MCSVSSKLGFQKSLYNIRVFYYLFCVTIFVMNKSIVRVLAILVLISPFFYVSSVYKDVFYILSGLLIAAATVTIKKKKKGEELDRVDK